MWRIGVLQMNFRLVRVFWFTSTKRIWNMDKDRIKGSAQQVKGSFKEAVGKVTGDEKLKAEGKADKVEGKVRSAIGGAKDALRGK
jgi:uncharacterized protein YjbJ (UPF0337 family)